MLFFIPIRICAVSTLLTNDDLIYTVVDEEAKPILGFKKVSSLVNSFVHEYPDYGGNGDEAIFFVVNSDGSIGEIRPELQLGQDIDMLKYNGEVSLIKSLKFKPAIIRGAKVASWQEIVLPYKGDRSQSKVAVGYLT